MRSEFEPRLGICYGAASTVAVMAWPDGRWWTLTFDGGAVLPSAVFVESAERLVAGVAAERMAFGNPGRLLDRPLRAGLGRVVVDDAEVEVHAAVTATLRIVAEEAARVSGARVEDVRLVVPAWWGPKRCTWMRQAAYRAGLGQPTLVQTPVAAAEQIQAHGVQWPVGSFVLVCDAGAGFEASVLRRGPAGFEVLSTLADADAGGDQIDAALAAAMAAVDAAAGHDELSEAHLLELRGNARVAKEGLARATALTVPMPASRPALVVNAAMLSEAAEPVVRRAAQLCADGVEAAELKPEQLTAVCCIGDGSRLSVLVDAIRSRLGIDPIPVSEPGLVAVFGALRAGDGLFPASSGPHEAPPVVVPVPLARRIAAMAVPGLASLALVAHFLVTADWGGGGSRTYRPAYSWVIVNWGELATAGVMALLCCLAAGSLLTVVTSGLDRVAARSAPLPPAAQAATGILAAAALGAAIAGLYAVLGSLYLDTEVTPFLRWSLLPLVPVIAAVTAIAWVSVRLRRVPVGGWDAFLAFPVSSVILVSAGTLLVQHSMRHPDAGASGRLGGLLIGVGIACAVVSRWVLRAVLALPLAVVMAAIVSWPGTGILAGICAVAVALWWGVRVWLLLRSPILDTRTVAAAPVAAVASPGG
ncbi:Hsp70 family protein [Paractinoplanes globisporus]|uniref:Hsp70 family protein n=1 Tax=Paractinoplanes globisporus TaxID=113565 RepID=A0ABW6WKR6_9ACTN|nr:Hsp70 family protein [Actinoplanes globisporus]